MGSPSGIENGGYMRSMAAWEEMRPSRNVGRMENYDVSVICLKSRWRGPVLQGKLVLNIGYQKVEKIILRECVDFNSFAWARPKHLTWEALISFFCTVVDDVFVLSLCLLQAKK